MEAKSNNIDNVAFPIIVKRSPAQLAMQVAFLLFISLLACIMVLVLGQILATLTQATYLALPLFAVIVIFIVAINIAITAFAFFKWNSEYYEIHENEIIFAHGIANKKRRSFPLDKIETMSVSQNFLERVFDFGDISLLNPILPDNRRLRMLDIPHPQKYIELIKQIQQHLIENMPRDNTQMIYRS